MPVHQIAVQTLRQMGDRYRYAGGRSHRNWYTAGVVQTLAQWSSWVEVLMCFGDSVPKFADLDEN